MKGSKTFEKTLPNDPRIKSEYNRLLKKYVGAPEDKMQLYRKLISTAAFLAVLLTDLEKDISENGYEEIIKGGAQAGNKRNTPASGMYVKYPPLYASLIKQLDSALATPAQEDGDPFA